MLITHFISASAVS